MASAIARPPIRPLFAPLIPAPAGEREARRVCGKVELNITRLLHEAMEI